MKVGDYCKIVTLSGQGGIAKLEKIDNICITDKGAVDKNNIIKSSPNIIDLIEVGDYVNGFLIMGRTDNELLAVGFLKFEENDIKSIVTKEQFSQMEYKVGE